MTPVGATALPLGTRLALRTKHLVQLVSQVARHGVHQRIWWLLPLVALLVLLAAAITTTTSALPVAVYTLF
ncbi:MAG: hypothetical protein R2702_11500 [Acidimicrobiales bacterium]